MGLAIKIKMTTAPKACILGQAAGLVSTKSIHHCKRHKILHRMFLMSNIRETMYALDELISLAKNDIVACMPRRKNAAKSFRQALRISN